MTETETPDGDRGPLGTTWYDTLRELHDTAPSPRRQELRRVADGARRIVQGLQNTQAPIEVLARIADGLGDLADLLADHPAHSMYEGFAEAANSGDPHAFFDHSPMLGLANPLAPPIKLSVNKDGVEGIAVFGPAYEGPPGCVHGGYVAAAFDEVLGSAQSLGGQPGMTGRLVVHYRKPTPLNKPLRFEGRLDHIEGRKTFTTGAVYDGELLTAEAEGLFISVDSSKFAQMRAERDGA